MMSIFDPESKKTKAYKYITVYRVPADVASYITLYALIKGYTRSFFIRDMLIDWYDEEVKNTSEQVLIDKIIYMAGKRWKLEKGKGVNSKYKEFEEYLDELERVMEYRGVERVLMQTILDKLYEKNEEGWPADE